MLCRPPKSTRTDTLFPCSTLFRSRDLGGERGDFPRGGWCIVLLGREPSVLHDVGEGDALPDRGQERRRIVIGERFGGFAGENRAGRAAVQQEARLEEIGRASCRERVCQYV